MWAVERCENGRLIASTRTAPFMAWFFASGPLWAVLGLPRGLPRARRRLRHLDVQLAVLLAFLLLPPSGGRKRFGSAKLHIACVPLPLSPIPHLTNPFFNPNPHPQNLPKPSTLLLRNRRRRAWIGGCWLFGSGRPGGVPPRAAPLGLFGCLGPPPSPKAAVGFRAVRAVFGPGFRPRFGGRPEAPQGPFRLLLII